MDTETFARLMEALMDTDQGITQEAYSLLHHFIVSVPELEKDETIRHLRMMVKGTEGSYYLPTCHDGEDELVEAFQALNKE